MKVVKKDTPDVTTGLRCHNWPMDLERVGVAVSDFSQQPPGGMRTA